MYALGVHNALVSITSSIQTLQLAHKEMKDIVADLQAQQQKLAPQDAAKDLGNPMMLELEREIQQLKAEMRLMSGEVMQLGSDVKRVNSDIRNTAQQRAVTEASIVMKCESQLSKVAVQQVNLLAESLDKRVQALEEQINIVQQAMMPLVVRPQVKSQIETAVELKVEPQDDGSSLGSTEVTSTESREKTM